MANTAFLPLSNSFNVRTIFRCFQCECPSYNFFRCSYEKTNTKTFYYNKLIFLVTDMVTDMLAQSEELLRVILNNIP